MKAKHAFTVERNDTGQRLDRFLVTAFETIGDPAYDKTTRAEIQRWIEHGRVTIGERVPKAADKVRAGDLVKVDPEPPPLSDAKPDARVPFDVLYTDDALVVVNKPPGVVVHPARGHETGTLVNGLLALGIFEAWESDEDDAHLRPGIVHRLDKGTSGVMVVARTVLARERLKEQFAAHTIDREYEAICVGRTESQTFETLHGRHPRDRLKFTAKVNVGKRACTHVRVLERFGDVATYVACRLETGRTHQIRVHLAESGTPIVGDPVYGRPSKNEMLRSIETALGHQALHARLLGFIHPTTRKPMRFEAPAPADFAIALTALRAFAP